MFSTGFTDDYFKPLALSFEAASCDNNAAAMKKYMKNVSDFLGLKSENRKSLQREFFRQYGLPPTADIHKSICWFWSQPYREYQYCGMEMMGKPVLKLKPEDIVTIEYMIVNKSWWDTVDLVAASVAGRYFIACPEAIPVVTEAWIRSDNIWLKRSALLFQLKYKNKTDSSLLFDYIRREAGHKDFFIRKAIGWALREYSKTDPQSVKDFIENTELSPLSVKEGLKIINKNKNKD